MSIIKARSTVTAIAAATCAIALVLVAPLSASAAGVGDVSAAVLYEASSPIGSVLTDLSTEDDQDTNVALPFPIAFNGIVANALCVSTNGYVVPIATIAGSCSSGAYDESLAEGSDGENQSVIGVLLHDIYLGNPLWKAAPVAIDTIGLASGVMTITTLAPHGFSVGNLIDVHAGLMHSASVVDSVVDPTTFTVLDSGPDFATQTFVGDAALAFDDAVDDTDSDGLADDTFGDVQQVYAGATTFEGKPAFAVTWYRVMSYEDENDGRASQTFQIVLVKQPTVDGATLGNSFSAQFNFGTVSDNELADGYDALNPDSDCDAARPDDCRFAVGIVYYDAVTDTATAQELFADVAKADLMDGGAQALVDNSLNSSVDGRYVLTVAAAPTLAATGTGFPAGALGVGLALLVLGGAILVVRQKSRGLVG
jgi:hypothetical protein